MRRLISLLLHLIFTQFISSVCLSWLAGSSAGWHSGLPSLIVLFLVSASWPKTNAWSSCQTLAMIPVQICTLQCFQCENHRWTRWIRGLKRRGGVFSSWHAALLCQGWECCWAPYSSRVLNGSITVSFCTIKVKWTMRLTLCLLTQTLLILSEIWCEFFYSYHESLLK